MAKNNLQFEVFRYVLNRLPLRGRSIFGLCSEVDRHTLIFLRLNIDIHQPAC
jgi:hypothetical protein